MNENIDILASDNNPQPHEESSGEVVEIGKDISDGYKKFILDWVDYKKQADDYYNFLNNSSK